ncbi:MAG: ABC transporter permease subunit [Anaerolineae bacterium]|nr:ABC transporter permease subunit [Anaerolineae bacterium]
MAILQPPPARPSGPLGFLRDLRFLRYAAQLVFLIAIVLLFAWLASNTAQQLQRASIPTSFTFLNQPSGFDIDEGFVDQPHTRTDTFAHGFVIATLNTLRVIVTGLVFATLLGLVVGIARLSTNWLVRNMALGFVEIMQNTPLLLQLFFLYSGVVLALPPARRAIELPGPSLLSVRGLATPSLVPTANAGLWFFFVALALVAGGTLWRRLRKIRIDTGRTTYAAETGLIIIAGVGVLAWMALIPFTVSLPRLQGSGYARGEGAILSPEFFALTLGLVLYTGAFIAEVVRSGIQSVPPGQWEAARSQGFSYGQILRLIVLPQALRVMIPPLTNQYLNLAKNSSLGAAVGFADLYAVAQTMQQSVPVIPVVIIIMSTYLVINLLVAFVMNMVNARVQLRTR